MFTSSASTQHPFRKIPLFLHERCVCLPTTRYSILIFNLHVLIHIFVQVLCSSTFLCIMPFYTASQLQIVSNFTGLSDAVKFIHAIFIFWNSSICSFQKNNKQVDIIVCHKIF
uniref:Uncharacterized protein LOC105648812 isoform X1 n=1 Tax=Rhizophora mucronata TaxID=61149 RepID=A0A2P2K5S5_RHIMU